MMARIATVVDEMISTLLQQHESEPMGILNSEGSIAHDGFHSHNRRASCGFGHCGSHAFGLRGG